MIAINEITNLVNDTRSKSIGGIEVAIEVFELAIIPYLLNSAGTWFFMKKSSLKTLNEIHNKFLQRILQTTSAMIPLMYWDTGQLLMTNRVIKMKILLMKHISSLDHNSLAFRVYKKEKNYSIDGLVTEVKEVLASFNISLNEMEETPSDKFKQIIRNKVEEKNSSDLLEMLKTYKKVDYNTISKEKFEIQPYMRNLSYEDSVFFFKKRARVCKTIRTHFKANKEFAEDLYSCWECSSEWLDTSIHVEECPYYQDLKESLDMRKTEDVVMFFRQVIQRWEDKQEELQT